MKKPEIARRIARAGRTNSAEAADHLDRVVSEILTKLKRGKPADMPGLGSFRPVSNGRVRFQEEERSHG